MHACTSMVKENPSWWSRCVAALLGRPAGRRDAVELPPHLRKPFVRRHWGYTSLQFARSVTQSRMLTLAPQRLLVDYTRTMMGALVVQPRPRLIGMIGLGGGSQAKFCHRHLPGARTEIVENNPHVIALRRRFRVPDDDARLQVFLDDGARFLAARPGRYDLLLVDGYDETGIPEALATQRFYDDCRAALAPGGALAVNLFCDDAERHEAMLRQAFGDSLLVVGETRMSNRVGIAWVAPAPAREGEGAAHATGVVGLDDEGRRQLAPVLARVAGALSQHRAQQRARLGGSGDQSKSASSTIR